MTSRNLKHFAAFGATAALVLAGMLSLEPVKARAQSESQAGRIEGTWQDNWSPERHSRSRMHGGLRPEAVSARREDPTCARLPPQGRARIA